MWLVSEYVLEAPSISNPTLSIYTGIRKQNSAQVHMEKGLLFLFCLLRRHDPESKDAGVPERSPASRA